MRWSWAGDAIPGRRNGFSGKIAGPSTDVVKFLRGGCDELGLRGVHAASESFYDRGGDLSNADNARNTTMLRTKDKRKGAS